MNLTYPVAAGLLFLVLTRALWRPRPTPVQPQRRLVVVCGECGRLEEVDEITEEVVGKWGEKIKCRKCRGAA